MDDIRKMKEFHFCKNHVFINGEFGYYRNNIELLLNTKDKHYIHRDHRVHIFISYDYSALNDGSLAWFINFCKSRTIKRVIIHIPKSNSILAKKIKKQLRYHRNWKLIIEKDGVEVWFGYSLRDIIPVGIYLAYLMTDLIIVSNKLSGSYDYRFKT